MFQSKSSSGMQDGVTIISKGCAFEGRLYCRGVSRIGGKVNGGITAEGTLIIEKDAMIYADIEADVVIIQGTIKGKIFASSKLELLKTSVVDGELVAPSILVEQGSTLNAAVHMVHPQEKRKADLVAQKEAEAAAMAATASEPNPADTDSQSDDEESVAKVEVLDQRKKRQSSSGSASSKNRKKKSGT